MPSILKLLSFSDAGEGAAGQSRRHELLDDMRCPAQRSNATAIARTLKLLITLYTAHVCFEVDQALFSCR